MEMNYWGSRWGALGHGGGNEQVGVAGGVQGREMN